MLKMYKKQLVLKCFNDLPGFCIFSQTFRTRKLGESTVFYVLYEAYLGKLINFYSS